MAFAMISCFVYKINWGVRRNLDSLAFSWEQRKLGDVVQITMGQSPDGSTYSDEPSDYILVQGNADLQNGWVCPRIWTTQITKKADAGDLIMSVRAPAGAMGKTAYNAVIGRGVAAIKGNEFIYQLLVKMDADGFWKILSCGSTFESLNSENIKNAEVKIPTTAEQIKIGGYFQQLDNLITLHQREYEKLHNIKKSMLEKMFPKNGSNVPEIRFKEFTEAWEQRKLLEFGLATGGTSIESEFSEDGVYKVISIGSYSEDNVYRDQGIRAVRSDKTVNRILNKGDITMILNDKTASGNIIGRVLLIEESGVYVYNQRTERIEVDNSNYDSQFIYTMLNAPAIRDRIIKQSQGNTQIYVNWTTISQTDYLVPQFSEQRKIGEYFANLDHLITLHQRELEKLQNIKKSMLEKMFVSEEKRK